MSSQFTPWSYHTVQFVKNYRAEQARAAKQTRLTATLRRWAGVSDADPRGVGAAHTDTSSRGHPPWRHLAIIVIGAVALVFSALLVAAARDDHPGLERGCYIDRYTQPADYPSCSTEPTGSSQARALEHR